MEKYSDCILNDRLLPTIPTSPLLPVDPSFQSDCSSLQFLEYAEGYTELEKMSREYFMPQDEHAFWDDLDDEWRRVPTYIHEEIEREIDCWQPTVSDDISPRRSNEEAQLLVSQTGSTNPFAGAPASPFESDEATYSTAKSATVCETRQFRPRSQPSPPPSETDIATRNTSISQPVVEAVGNSCAEGIITAEDKLLSTDELTSTRSPVATQAVETITSSAPQTGLRPSAQADAGPDVRHLNAVTGPRTLQSSSNSDFSSAQQHSIDAIEFDKDTSQEPKRQQSDQIFESKVDYTSDKDAALDDTLGESALDEITSIGDNLVAEVEHSFSQANPTRPTCVVAATETETADVVPTKDRHCEITIMEDACSDSAQKVNAEDVPEHAGGPDAHVKPSEDHSIEGSENVDTPSHQAEIEEEPNEVFLFDDEPVEDASAECTPTDTVRLQQSSGRDIISAKEQIDKETTVSAVKEQDSETAKAHLDLEEIAHATTPLVLDKADFDTLISPQVRNDDTVLLPGPKTATFNCDRDNVEEVTMTSEPAMLVEDESYGIRTQVPTRTDIKKDELDEMHANIIRHDSEVAKPPVANEDDIIGIAVASEVDDERPMGCSQPQDAEMQERVVTISPMPTPRPSYPPAEMEPVLCESKDTLILKLPLKSENVDMGESKATQTTGNSCTTRESEHADKLTDEQIDILLQRIDKLDFDIDAFSEEEDRGLHTLHDQMKQLKVVLMTLAKIHAPSQFSSSLQDQPSRNASPEPQHKKTTSSSFSSTSELSSVPPTPESVDQQASRIGSVQSLRHEAETAYGRQATRSETNTLSRDTPGLFSNIDSINAVTSEVTLKQEQDQTSPLSTQAETVKAEKQNAAPAFQKNQRQIDVINSSAPPYASTRRTRSAAEKQLVPPSDRSASGVQTPPASNKANAFKHPAKVHSAVSGQHDLRSKSRKPKEMTPGAAAAPATPSTSGRARRSATPRTSEQAGTQNLSKRKTRHSTGMEGVDAVGSAEYRMSAGEGSVSTRTRRRSGD